MATEQLIVPTLHLNGTSRQSLLDQVCDAGFAIGKAADMLANAGPNGRDYYPQGPAAMRLAVAQHNARMDRLRGVIAELQEIAESINGQEGGR